MIMAAAEEQQKPDQRQDEQQQQQQQQKQDEEDKKQKEQEDEKEEEESPPESPPSKVARVSPDDSSDAGTVTTAVASPLLLGLGLGTSSSTACACACACGCWGGFTFMQIQEFHHQALIFKHMVAGIPVPIHLILPIWKSVAASYGPHHYPSFVGLGKLCYDFKNSMEQEPGRCRRTDGKKWRCSRDVVPDQKYCERHMHRGRSRSRNHVEGAAAAPSTNLSITIPDDDGPTNIININSSSDVTTAAAVMIGSTPISVLSSRAACKTGAA